MPHTIFTVVLIHQQAEQAALSKTHHSFFMVLLYCLTHEIPYIHVSTKLLAIKLSNELKFNVVLTGDDDGK